MKVFISYISRDKEIARELSIELKKNNISTFIDESLEPGVRISRQISSLLESSDAIIAILSKYSFSSEWVRKELDEALFNEKFKDKFFPVLLSNSSDDLSRLPWVLQKINHLRLSPDEPKDILGKKITKEFLRFLKKGSDYAS